MEILEPLQYTSLEGYQKNSQGNLGLDVLLLLFVMKGFGTWTGVPIRPFNNKQDQRETWNLHFEESGNYLKSEL